MRPSRCFSGLVRGSLAIAGAALFAGCHTYTAVDTPPPGSTVRVHIPVRSALDDPNAPIQTRSVEGQVLESGDTIVLAIRNRQEYGAYREILQFDTLRLGNEQRVSVEVREFSNRKSVVLGVGLTVIVALAAVSAFDVEDPGGSGPPDPPPPPPAIVSRSLISSLIGLVFGN